ncbi:Calmodulin (CaM) [Durusdinium trenchii]|uniref:Calmodulin n=1 Tax=Durusdinium trenchii TaxID=1381693 RepID=A0ABP0L9G9_9DINO
MGDADGEGDGLTGPDRLKYTEAFNIFDKHQQGYIPWKPDFAKLWRAIGQNPTEAELRRIIEENDTGTGHFQLETFLKLCENREDALRKEQLIEAFKTFDKDGKGTLTIAQIRYVMMTMGDPLNDEEADRFIDFADKNKEGPTAEIDYEELVERLDDIDPGDKV